MQKKILIVQQELGVYSEVFLYRMLNGFHKVDIELLVGQHRNKHDFPFSKVKLWGKSAGFFARAYYFIQYRFLGSLGVTNAKLGNVIQAINNSDADLVCFQFGFLPALIGIDIAKINKPFCIIHHGTDVNQAIENKLYHQRLKLVWEQADKLIFVSEFLMGAAKKLGCPEQKMCVNYLGVPDFEISKYHSKITEPFKFIMVARMVPVKNHVNAIDAFARAIKETNEPMQLTLIGYGDLENSIEDQVLKLGINKNIRMLGRLCNERVIEEIAHSDCVVLVSRIHSIKGITNQQEGLPISLLEGARLGLPAIACNTGGIPEIIEQGSNGYLVNPLDIDDIKDAMLKMVENSEKTKTMGEKSKLLVQNKFDFNKQMKKIERIFLNVLE